MEHLSKAHRPSTIPWFFVPLEILMYWKSANLKVSFLSLGTTTEITSMSRIKHYPAELSYPKASKLTLERYLCERKAFLNFSICNFNISFLASLELKIADDAFDRVLPFLICFSLLISSISCFDIFLKDSLFVSKSLWSLDKLENSPKYPKGSTQLRENVSRDFILERFRDSLSSGLFKLRTRWDRYLSYSRFLS